MCTNVSVKSCRMFMRLLLVSALFSQCSSDLMSREELIEAYAELSAINYNVANAQRNDVSFLYANGLSGLVELTPSNASDVLNLAHPVVFVAHGYKQNISIPWFNIIRDNYIKRTSGKVNIIFLNWCDGASNYPLDVSFANVYPIGNYISEFVIATKMNVETIHFIGFDLGAHIGGFLGKILYLHTSKKIGRITALDPTGPKFDRANVPANSRLDKSDASYVEVHHCDVQALGVTKPYGHIDYYINGGYNQPGCSSDIVENSDCSHLRCPYVYAESLNTNILVKKGIFLSDGVLIYVRPNIFSIPVFYGGSAWTFPRFQHGIYFVKTWNKTPYLRYF
ncbi:lipase member I-like isoform X2 [Diabrotica virgifera virgifera]|uniref:Lipase domain-containing protein n=1 Tax=Diabrotica virgifera virgifera TaxID=50390 RepID=A0ABM5JTU3_DIAVI|nr:lipase member I-like isoform X2 [Diabrotica virgifera virgifera]